MKILHFISSVDPAHGGTVEALRQRCDIYRAGGHDVEVASLDSPQFTRRSDLASSVTGLGPGHGTYGYSANAVPWLKANVSRFDVVFVDGVWNYNTLAAHKALAGTDIPWAIFTHGMLDPYFKKRFPLKHFKKSIYWHAALSRVFRDASAVLFTCEEEKMLARQSFSRYKVREAVVPFGTFGPSCDLSAAAEEFLAQWPDLRGRRVALSLGRIHPKKSTDILIQSFAATLERDPEWQLVIAGPDQIGWQKELEAMAADLGIANRVTWTGSLSGNMKWGAFSASEIFVLPSHQENFGIVVAEALACGLPVILSNKVNIWREIESYNAGFVGEDTVPATIATLERWSGLERNQIELLRANSRTCFTECFDYKATARKVLENVDEIARSTPRYKAANGSFIATRS